MRTRLKRDKTYDLQPLKQKACLTWEMKFSLARTWHYLSPELNHDGVLHKRVFIIL